ENSVAWARCVSRRGQGGEVDPEGSAGGQASHLCLELSPHRRGREGDCCRRQNRPATGNHGHGIARGAAQQSSVVACTEGSFARSNIDRTFPARPRQSQVAGQAVEHCDRERRDSLDIIAPSYSFSLPLWGRVGVGGESLPPPLLSPTRGEGEMR